MTATDVPGHSLESPGGRITQVRTLLWAFLIIYLVSRIKLKASGRAWSSALKYPLSTRVARADSAVFPLSPAMGETQVSRGSRGISRRPGPRSPPHSETLPVPRDGQGPARRRLLGSRM